MSKREVIDLVEEEDEEEPIVLNFKKTRVPSLQESASPHAPLVQPNESTHPGKAVLIQTPTSALVTYELEPEIATLLQQCIQEADPELDHHPEIQIFGKTCHQQRSIGFFSDTSVGYNYSTTITRSKQMKPCLSELLAYVNHKFDASFNGILINKYENGEEYIGKHSDDERGLQPTCGVIAMSFGAVRKFRIRDKVTGKIVLDVPTEANKIIQMAGNFQREFTHEIPVEKKVKQPRYSLTFRRHLM